jgi:hypothetical protein
MSLTREEVLRLLADGKPVEVVFGDKTWLFEGKEEWGRLGYFDKYKWHAAGEKPPVEMVDLEMADIDLHRDLFRFGSRGSWEYSASGRHETGVIIDREVYTFAALHQGWQRSGDSGATWEKCEKPKP